VEPSLGKRPSKPPRHNDSVPKGVNDHRGNNVEGFFGCLEEKRDGKLNFINFVKHLSRHRYFFLPRDFSMAILARMEIGSMTGTERLYYF
jgi:hypothetical protein